MALDLGTLVAYLDVDSSKLDSGLDGAERKGGAFAKNMAKVGLAAAAGVAAAAKGLYEVGETFDDVSDTIRVGTGATGKDLKALEDAAKNVGTAVPASFEDVGTTIADLNTRLGLTGPTLEKLSKQFLEAGRITGESLNIKEVTAAFNAFDVRGKATTRALDDIYRVSQATGVSMNELASSVARNAPNLRQFGFSLSESAALIGTLDKAGLNSNRTLATLSRAMVEFAEKGRDPQKALAKTVDRIKEFTKTGEDAKAVNLAADIFGTRGAGQFVAAIKAGKINLEDLMGATGATGDKILKAGKDTQDFAEKWQMFKNQVLVKLEPIATRVFGAFASGADKVFPVVLGLFEEIDAGVGVGGKLADVAATIADALGNVARVGLEVGAFMAEHKTLTLTLVGAMTALVAVTQLHAAVLAVQAAGGLAAYLKGTTLVTAVTKTWTAVQWAMNAALAANPIGLVIGLLVALGAAVVVAYKKSETFRNVVKGAFEAVGAAGRWLWNNVLQPVFQFLVRGFATVMDWYAKMLRGLSKVPGFGWAAKAADGMENAADKARELANDIKKIPSSKQAKVTVDVPNLTAVSDRLDWVARPRQARITITQEYARAGRQTQGGLQERHVGGSVLANQPYLVGREGAEELFVPHTSGRIYTSGQVAAGMGTSGGHGRELRPINVYDRSGDPVRTAVEVARQEMMAGVV